MCPSSSEEVHYARVAVDGIQINGDAQPGTIRNRQCAVGIQLSPSGIDHQAAVGPNRFARGAHNGLVHGFVAAAKRSLADFEGTEVALIQENQPVRHDPRILRQQGGVGHQSPFRLDQRRCWAPMAPAPPSSGTRSSASLFTAWPPSAPSMANSARWFCPGWIPKPSPCSWRTPPPVFPTTIA